MEPYEEATHRGSVLGKGQPPESIQGNRSMAQGRQDTAR